MAQLKYTCQKLKALNALHYQSVTTLQKSKQVATNQENLTNLLFFSCMAGDLGLFGSRTGVTTGVSRKSREAFVPICKSFDFHLVH